MNETLFNMNSIMVYAVLLLVTILIAYFLQSIASGLQKGVGSSKKKDKASSKLGCLALLILFLLAFSLVSLTAYLRAFNAFTAQELVAIVECSRTDAKGANFRLHLVPVIHNEPQEEQVFEMAGNQWAIGGDVLKWRPAVNFMGLHTLYRLTRLEGRYETVAETREKKASAYSLIAEEKSEIWRFLYEIGGRLPLVVSAYGNTVYTNPSFTDRFMVYVTTSGYMVERERIVKKTVAGEWLEQIIDSTRPVKNPSPR